VAGQTNRCIFATFHCYHSQNITNLALFNSHCFPTYRKIQTFSSYIVLQSINELLKLKYFLRLDSTQNFRIALHGAGNMYTYIHKHTHTHTHIYIYIYIYCIHLLIQGPEMPHGHKPYKICNPCNGTGYRI